LRTGGSYQTPSGQTHPSRRPGRAVPNWRYHAFVTDRVGTTVELDADHRRHATVELAIRDLKGGVGLRHHPSGKFAANAAWLVIATLAHNLLRWVAAIGPGTRQELVVAKTLRRTLFSLPGRLTPLRQAMEVASARRLALGTMVRAGAGAAALHRLRHLTHATAGTHHSRPTGVRVSLPGRRPAS